MSATKILWGQILTVFLIVLMTTWGATQWTAWRLGFQAQLGPHWFEFAGWPIYYPPAIFWWWYFYEAYASGIFVEGGLIAASGGFIAIAVAIGMSVWRAREAKHAATYGSARWADKTEIKAAGLLDPDGVVLGRFEREYLRHDGPEHVLCFAPTRSGHRPRHQGRELDRRLSDVQLGGRLRKTPSRAVASTANIAFRGGMCCQYFITFSHNPMNRWRL